MPAWIPSDERELPDEDQQEVLGGELQDASRWTGQRRDGRGQQQPGEHPEERLGQDGALDRRPPRIAARCARPRAACSATVRAAGRATPAGFRKVTSMTPFGSGPGFRDGVAALDSARSAARAKTHSRSARRFRYGMRFGPGTWPARWRATARRSARRRIVRASSRAALVGVSPGTTNSLGIAMLRLELDEVALQVLDHRLGHAGPAVLEAIPGLGVGGQLGADHEQLALEAEDQRARARRDRPAGCRCGA